MTIRLNYEGRPGKIKAEFSRAGDDVYNLYSDSAANTVLATCDTLEEAEQAKRAFELVFAPRFTRDEAIAIVLPSLPPKFQHDRACMVNVDRECGLCNCSVIQREGDFVAGVRAALEALAAAGAFSDCGPPECFSRESCAQIMADKLDAAGIR